MKSIIVVGSADKNSHSLALGRELSKQLESLGVESRVWDLAEDKLGEFKIEYHNDQSSIDDPQTAEFVSALNAADMVGLVSPLYHGTISGVLKSAIDILVKDQLRDKPVGLMCNGGGLAKTTQVLNHLTIVTQTLYGIPMQTQIGTSESDYLENEDVGGYKVVSEDIVARCERLAREMVKFHKALK